MPLAQAIQIHRPIAISPISTVPMMPNTSTPCTWVGVRLGDRLMMSAFRLPTVTRPRITPIAFRVAPAYMSRTAVCTERGWRLAGTGLIWLRRRCGRIWLHRCSLLDAAEAIAAW